MKTFISGLIIGLLVMTFVFGMFYLGSQRNKAPSNLSVEIEQDENSEDEIKLEIITTPVAVAIDDKSVVEVQASILTAVSSKDYESIGDDMADSVYVSLHASECCGDITPDAAIENLNYLNNATTPWLFDRTNLTLASLAATYPETMGPDFIIGISDNNIVVSFGLNEDNEINEIHIIPNADMLLL